MIVVFGSINIDFIVSLENLPCPGETVLGPGYRTLPGGKGANQAAAAAKAGGQVRFAGAVGRDMFANLPLAALKVVGVDIAAVRHTEAAPTGAAFICVDAAGENQIAVALGANARARAEQVPDDWLNPETTLLLQMELPAAESWRLAERARARGARVLLNLAPALPIPAGALDSLDALTLNEVEALALARDRGLDTDDPAAAARVLAQAHDLRVILNLGAQGAGAIAPDEELIVSALPVTPVDTTGAGDAFVGVLAAGLDNGAGLAEALRYASVAGGLACEREGAMASLPSLKQIEARLGELAPPISRS